MAAKTATGAWRSKEAPPSAALLWTIMATAVLVSAVFRPTGPVAKARPEECVAAGRERGRGRHAEKPSDIQLRGWKDILVRVRQGIAKGRLVPIAAGIAFFELLAIFPALAALVSLYGLFADPASIGSHLDAMAGFIPAEGLQILHDQMARVAAKSDDTLSLTFGISLALSLWSANSGTKALFDALNVVYEEEEKRSFLKLNAISLLFTVGGIFMFLAAMAAMVVIPVVLDYVGLSETAGTLVALIRWPLLLVGIGIWLTLLYRFGPSREQPQWRWVSWGSAFAAITWLAASMLFSWYAANFASYNETYGSLGAMIGFATWLWLSAIVILIGGKINAEMEHQTVHDTTTGSPLPLGARGATMADTVGEAHS
jgi:membrane protein